MTVEDKYKRLKAMVEHGTKHEQEVAKKKIELLMQKYNITETDLKSDEIEKHPIKIRNEMDKRILHQIVYMICDGEIPIFIWTKGKKKNKEILIECSKSMYKEILIAFEFYRDLFDEEIEILYQAFLHKHNIFPSEETMNKDRDEDKTMDREMLLRMAIMQNALQDKTLHKVIEEKIEVNKK